MRSLVHDIRLKQGDILDAWLIPIKEKRKLSPSQPIIFINTEGFVFKENIDQIRKVSGESQENRMLFIKGSLHQNHVDTALIFKSPMLKRIVGMNSETDPLVVLDISTKLIVQFLWRYVGIFGYFPH